MSRAREAQDRAAQWIVAREEPGWSDADQAELDAWLAQSDMNRVAYARLNHSWREVDRMAALGRGATPLYAGDVRPRIRRTGWRVPIAVAASLLAAVGVPWLAVPWFSPEPTQVATVRFDTPVGGHKRLGLSDGSRVELNTASVVRAALGKTQREVWLDRGEAYFEVAQDKARPFVVHAGKRQVAVLGTKFSVRREGDQVTVSVLEGRVRIDDIEDARAVRSTTITGGDIAMARGPATLVTARSEKRVEDTLAWREGMLNFDQAPLSEVAAEFNRYNRQQLVVSDAGAGSIRIGGMFPASSPATFVRLLRDAYGLKIEETPEAIKITD